MPIPNVSKSMQGFGDLTYCGHPVIMGCVVCSSAGGIAGFAICNLVDIHHSVVVDSEDREVLELFSLSQE